jgi:RNA polymerase sigma factor (sigma-70 family)
MSQAHPPEQTLELLSARDQDAFTRLVVMHDAELVRLCFVICGDVEMARDATQNTWHRLWSRPPSLRDASKLRPWLLTVAANEARQIARRRRTGYVRELEYHTRRTETATVSDFRIDLAELLRKLAPDERQLLGLRYVLGLSSEEIGAVLGVSAEGARSRLHRLLSKIRKNLKDV